ncbi:replication factor C subunit 2/4 [Acrasis kona]|uniref:Replication factor C subunit 2 n=1 Tax=Acrasis kona TaxID=1008807 RepID=A0AAW2YZ96_9EUKA
MSSTAPWVEKYRPNTIDQVVYQDEVVQALKKALESSNLPHLLFYGPPGTGKTSTILAIAKQLFGPELYRSRVLELNASDERGIEVIRTKVKTFAQASVGMQSVANKAGYPCPPFKLIVLDEADSMTKDAQAALRRTMETYSKVTRFCIVCNYVSRIIEPLVSRCAKFRFKALEPTLLRKRLSEVAEKEQVKVTNDALDRIVDVSEGDMRRALTVLQSATRTFGKEIKPNHVDETAAVVPDQEIEDLLNACIDVSDKKDMFKAMQKQCAQIVRRGHSAVQVVSQLNNHIISSKNLTNVQKARIALEFGNVDKCLTDGADEYLQLLSLSSHILRIKAELDPKATGSSNEDAMSVDDD